MSRVECRRSGAVLAHARAAQPSQGSSGSCRRAARRGQALSLCPRAAVAFPAAASAPPNCPTPGRSPRPRCSCLASHSSMHPGPAWIRAVCQRRGIADDSHGRQRCFGCAPVSAAAPVPPRAPPAPPATRFVACCRRIRRQTWPERPEALRVHSLHQARCRSCDPTVAAPRNVLARAAARRARVRPHQWPRVGHVQHSPRGAHEPHRQRRQRWTISRRPSCRHRDEQARLGCALASAAQRPRR